MIELLAPAKDKICAKAAIDFGADAVYIGANEFGARKNAPNSLEDIEEIVNYAHKFKVKVYVTINTILTDDEILQAKELIEKLEKIGVDAIIIQDMGLLQEAKMYRCKDAKSCHCEEYGDEVIQSSKEQSPFIKPFNLSTFQPFNAEAMPLHASTQCDNRTVEKVKFLEDVGFSRVILARELSIEQIKEIKKQTSVELETFIHGALCVSYSGQCYLSEMIGGRSANRGECAQPCRKKYSLVDEEGNFIAKEKHLLSLKDFNASKHLKALANAGVTSFKIEGRLKDENYVKNVVGYYRKLIDELNLGKTSSGKVIFDFEPNLDKSFNREFTDYFLDRAEAEVWGTTLSQTQRRLSRGNSTSDIFTFDSPKSKGEYIGKVTKVGENYFEISLPSPLAEQREPSRDEMSDPVGAAKRVREGRVRGNIHPQDGLCFLVNDKLSGCLVNKVDEVEAFRSGTFGTQQKIFPYKMDGIKVGTNMYRNFNSEFEKTLKNSKTCRKIEADIEFNLGTINAVDEDSNSAEIQYSFEELAQNEEKMELNIINQLKKSGDSDFEVNEVKINTEKIPFLPVSKINELRRELLKKLMKERCKDAKTLRGIEALKNPSDLQPFSHSTLDYRANVLNKYAKEFYKKHGCEITEMAIESGKTNKSGKVAMTTKHCLKYAFNMCKSEKTLFLIDEKGKRYELKFNCENCEMEIIF